MFNSKSIRYTAADPNLCAWPHIPGRKRNVLFNDALNTFYSRLYGVRYIPGLRRQSLKILFSGGGGGGCEWGGGGVSLEDGLNPPLIQSFLFVGLKYVICFNDVLYAMGGHIFKKKTLTNVISHVYLYYLHRKELCNFCIAISGDW